MGAAINLDPRRLALVVSSQNFRREHTGSVFHCYSVVSLRAIFEAIQGVEFTFSGKKTFQEAAWSCCCSS